MEGLARVSTSVLLLSLACAATARAEPTEKRVPIVLEVLGTRPHPHESSHRDALTTSVVHREKLGAPGLTAAEVLRVESGVEVVQYGGFGSPATASIRGATAAQTPIYLGGIRLNDEVAGAADLSTIPLWLVERVEIYRGNAPLGLDQFGIGGAIAFEPLRPRSGQAGAGVFAGSFGTAGGYAWAAQSSERRRTLVGAALTHARNDYTFDDNRGTLFVPGDDRESRQQNADLSLLDAWTLSTFDLPGGARVEVLGNVIEREQGVPRLALLPSEKSRARYERVLFGVRARTPFGPGGKHRLELATSLVAGRSVYEDPAYELVLLVPRMKITGRRAAQHALAEFELSPQLVLTTTLDASVDQLLREEGDRSELGSTARSGRAAVGLSWEPWPGLFLLPVLGLACRSAVERGALCEEREPVGRVAVAHRSQSLSVFAGFGRYVRFPSLGEVHGGGVLLRGNPHLVAEDGLTGDLGARFRHAFGTLDFWGDLAAYTRRVDRLIGYVRSSQGYLVPMNVRSARVSGVEAAAGAELAKRVGVDLALTFVEPEDVTRNRRGTNAILPFHSRFKAAVGVSARLDASRARLSALHLSSRYADPAGLIVIPGQTSFDLELEQGFADDTIQARVRVANLFDAPRFDVVGYPHPGQSVFLAMEVLLK